MARTTDARGDGGFDPVDFLVRAVQTPSHEDVGEMRELLVDELATHGHAARVDEAGNVLATREGGAGTHVVLNTHLDTVTPHVPYGRDGDVIRGRGSCDAKGPLAALLAAFLAVDPAGGRVTLAVTPDEETLSTGAAALDLDADAYVVGEPTALDVCNAAKGRFEGTVTLRGANAHAAEPQSGVNAVAAAEQALAAVRTFDDGREAHPSLGAPTLTPTVVRGGEATNQVPATCDVTVDRRSVPPETASDFEAELTDAVREAVPARVGVEFAFVDRETPFLGPFHTPDDDPLVATLRAASGGSVRPFTAATEASYFAEDAPTVVFGPGVLADEEGAVAHADREYVRVSEVRAAADAVGATLRELV